MSVWGATEPSSSKYHITLRSRRGLMGFRPAIFTFLNVVLTVGIAPRTPTTCTPDRGGGIQRSPSDRFIIACTCRMPTIIAYPTHISRTIRRKRNYFSLYRVIYCDFRCNPGKRSTTDRVSADQERRTIFTNFAPVRCIDSRRFARKIKY